MAIKECVICGVQFDARGTVKTCSAECLARHKLAYQRAYDEANREKVRSRKKAYREANLEKMKAQAKARSKAYREANLEKAKATQKACYEAKIDQYRLSHEKWRRVQAQTKTALLIAIENGELK